MSSQWKLPEFEYLKNCQWHFTEKIDGTNMRLIYHPTKTEPGFELKGRSNAATVHPKLTEWLAQWSSFALPLATELFETPVCIYGEGCGAGIQSGANQYGDTHFRAFAIKIGDWWLKPEDVMNICRSLHLKVVPHVFTGTLMDGISIVQRGRKTMIGPEPGIHEMEGLIGVPTVPLRRRNGERIVVKLKHKDLKDLEWYNGT